MKEKNNKQNPFIDGLTQFVLIFINYDSKFQKKFIKVLTSGCSFTGTYTFSFSVTVSPSGSGS